MTGAGSPAATYTIAHLSDLHLTGDERAPRSEPRLFGALRLLCLVAGVRLIVHGHLHRHEDRRVNALRIVGAPASTEPRASAGGRCLPFLAYELGASGRVRVARRWVPVPA